MIIPKQRLPPPLVENQVRLFSNSDGKWLVFSSPVEIVVARTASEVLPALATIEHLVEEQGYAAAGWVSYEAAPAFDGALTVHHDDSGFPLLWFGIYPVPLYEEPPAVEELPPLDWQPTVSREQYIQAVREIKRLIAAGETYQVNYTFRRRARLAHANAAGLLSLLAQQPPYYGGCITTDQWIIASGSPELFFRLDQDRIVSRPMKGTAPRGRWSEEDVHHQRQLHRSRKNRAENIMIVDMVRNDLGRMATRSSVIVPSLFTVEQYPTLLQMTSTVEARTSASLSAIFQALFPPASITGAPKATTMEIIARLERQPRRIYTGTMGYLLPGRQAQFAVAIRTLLYDRQQEEVEYGVGSGIVWDSDPEEEFRECRTKTRICAPGYPPFALLETLLWTNAGGYHLLEEHCLRLEASARYFAYPFDRPAFFCQLADAATGFSADRCRVRVTLQADGTLDLIHQPLATVAATATVALAAEPVNTDDIFLYHKTTHRAVYDQARHALPQADDVLLYNERGELTESTIANMLMEINGSLYTPPVRCGLLAGTARARLLAEGVIRERVLPVSLLEKGWPLYLINSVRGRYRAVMV